MEGINSPKQGKHGTREHPPTAPHLTSTGNRKSVLPEELTALHQQGIVNASSGPVLSTILKKNSSSHKYTRSVTAMPTGHAFLMR
ncbi:hypothetical protein ACRRTK_005402 [Alexandromys fortis]